MSVCANFIVNRAGPPPVCVELAALARFCVYVMYLRLEPNKELVRFDAHPVPTLLVNW